MNIEESIRELKGYLTWLEANGFSKLAKDSAIETLLTAYEKEKEKNKNAIDFINERKKIVNTDMAEGTRLQVGTFMWQVDELLEILKGMEEE